MEDHFQKSQDDFGSLTEQIIFKGGVQNNNNNNNNLDNNSQAINNENKIYSIEKKHDDLLSFRKGGKKSGYDIEALCEKVSNLLINHEIEQNKIEKEKKTDFKKMFMKTTEKELEIFESERLIKKESFENINEKENNEDIIENENNEDNKLNINSNDNDNEKCLSQVICTLSKIEGGYATFVSSNDLIFVLPSLFIPKDLNPGSSYIFELCELEYAENKINQVNKIHKMYSKDLVEEINDKNNDEKD